ncbi:hypothetical protein M513_14309, partial [Trichuris suis]
RGHSALPDVAAQNQPTDPIKVTDRQDLRRRWAYQQRMLTHFWRRCCQEYIVTLSTRRRWTNTTAEPQVGDIVLIAEDNVAKCKWPLGRVVQKFPSHDGLTRTVQLKTIKGMVTRPVAKLHLLEAAEND